MADIGIRKTGIMDEILTLDKLERGMDAFIESVKCENKALRQHILDMGLIPGVEVALVKTAPLGDPLEIRLRGYELTIRKKDASKIFIRDIHSSHNCPRKNKKFKETEHSQKGESQIYTAQQNKAIQQKTNYTFALAGNPNSGKTTLFNKLTGSNQRAGNFPGVTVEKKYGLIEKHKNITLTDLPGIYSLSPYSSEELITRNFILNEKPDGIINIIDASNIERNLLLTMQLAELNIPMVIALNMMDEVTENGGSIDTNGIENRLGIPVIPVCALKNQGIEELTDHALNVAKYKETPKRIDFCEDTDGEKGAVHRCIHSIIHLIELHAKESDIPVRFAATKLTEGDALILQSLNLDKNDKESCSKIIKQMEEERGLDRQAALADMRYAFIEKLAAEFVNKPDETTGEKLSRNADKILTGRYSAIPVFFIIMALIFYFSFGSFGAFFSRITEYAITAFTNRVDAALSAYGLNSVVHSLIINGIFAGVGSVLSFLPLIIVLFFFLALLEDSGYMARVAFVMDKLLRKTGLSGRSIVPMLMGFGCSVPAIMAARTLPSERDRKMTILLTPFMSCSAKLPIYALFTAAFFEDYQVIVITGLYMTGIITGIIFAFIMKYTVFKGETVPFVMELPNYRMPGIRNVYRLIYSKTKDFITKAFTIIFGAAIIIWFLQSLDTRLNLAQEPSQSLLAIIGNMIAPVFRPLGLDDWRISAAFMTGFTAKESVVSTLSVLLNGNTEKLHSLFTPLSACSFLIFSLLYTPCAAAVAAVKRELGRLYSFIVVLLQCSIAWFVSFIIYTVLNCFFK